MIDIAAMSLVGDWMDTCLPDEEVAENIIIVNLEHCVRDFWTTYLLDLAKATVNSQQETVSYEIEHWIR